MGAIVDAFESVYRDFVTPGLPASGDHEPVKADIRAIGAQIETSFAASLGTVDVVYATLAELNADLDWPAASTALVFADANPLNIDLYLKSEASGSGAWSNTGALRTIVSGLAADILTETTDLLAQLSAVTLQVFETSVQREAGILEGLYLMRPFLPFDIEATELVAEVLAGTGTANVSIWQGDEILLEAIEIGVAPVTVAASFTASENANVFLGVDGVDGSVTALAVSLRGVPA